MCSAMMVSLLRHKPNYGGYCQGQQRLKRCDFRRLRKTDKQVIHQYGYLSSTVSRKRKRIGCSSLLYFMDSESTPIKGGMFHTFVVTSVIVKVLTSWRCSEQE